MIKVHTIDNQKPKILAKVCKKLDISEENVTFAAYEKFFFSYLFALAIKENKIYIFATDEGGRKSNIYSTYDSNKVKNADVDKRTDFNLHLTNGNIINLTSLVGISMKNKRIVSLFNEYIKKAHY